MDVEGAICDQHVRRWVGDWILTANEVVVPSAGVGGEGVGVVDCSPN
jgi:hypothetical protein